MKTLQNNLIVLTALLSGLSANAGLAAGPLTNVPACIQLRDQYNEPQKLSFPNPRVTLLTIADRKGSEQIPGWVKPVKQRFDTCIDIRGVADMSRVPGPLRGLVKRQFRDVQPYPVMLDWTGDTVKDLAYIPGEADVLVLDRDGKILYRTRGKASGRTIQDLCDAVEQALSTETPRTSSK